MTPREERNRVGAQTFRFRFSPSSRRVGGQTRPVQYTLFPVRRPRLKLLLQSSQYLFVAAGLLCLGVVGFNYGGARLFQAYKSWQFDRTLRTAAGPPRPNWLQRLANFGPFHMPPARSDTAT